MRVLITGALGFAGRHLAERCAAEGAEVVGVGRRQAPEAELPAALSDYARCDLVEFSETEQAIRSTAPDRVFHLAAEASVARSWDDPGAAVLGNLSGTLNVLEALRRHAPEASLLLACSGEEYGVPERLPVDERHPLRPQNPYAVGKAAGDLAAGFFADTYGLRAVRVRAFNHAGPGQSAGYVVANLARQIAAAEAAGGASGTVELLTGNLDARRDFTDVRDVVRAYWLALERAEPDVYNVCSGRSVAVGELLATLAEHTDLEVKARVDPSLPHKEDKKDVMEIVGSHDKLTQATGWQPEIALETTLRDALDWWRQRAPAEVTG
jgi:GDP-4-dehydro-6-deoxy-D-mannose reductase